MPLSHKRISSNTNTNYYRRVRIRGEMDRKKVLVGLHVDVNTGSCVWHLYVCRAVWRVVAQLYNFSLKTIIMFGDFQE